MRKTKTAVLKSEKMKNKWVRHIVYEKELCETSARWMAQRMETLLDYMQYGNALVAYYKQDGTFCLVRASLRHYEADFRRPFEPESVRSTLVYKDVDRQQWCTFRIENFLEWKPIV